MHIVWCAIALSCVVCGPTSAAEVSGAPVLDEALSALRGCEEAYFSRHPEVRANVGAAMVANGVALELLDRMTQGAPPKWQNELRNEAYPLAERVEGAIAGVGMAISHGNPGEQLIARAYAAYFLAPVTGGECVAPPVVADFVRTHDFWNSNDTPAQ